MWSSGSSSEESREYLQLRLGFLYQLMFWCYAVLVGFLAIIYTLDSDIEPEYQSWIYLLFTSGLAIQGTIWRAFLVRRRLSFATLQTLDTFYAVGANTVIAAAALISFDQRQAAYACVIYSCASMLTRALIVPSDGRRTARVTALAAIPMTVAAIALPFVKQWPAGKDVPALGFLLGYIQIQAVTILLAAAGSEIIYNLRSQVTRTTRRLGSYTLDRKIGEGGMGVVYLAHHDMLRRSTAIKLLHPQRVGKENLERFAREVRHLSQLTHPNTVAVYDYGRSFDGLFYYAMEYLPGIDLHQLVTTDGPQPSERVRQILLQVCGALHEAHERGIVHRDIKPANIILCSRGEVPDVAKVVDFGLVKELTADTGVSTQIIFGTPEYLAPEVIHDPNAIGPGADLYALGCVGYFLLTGTPVFAGATPIDICIAHATKAPTPPSHLPGIQVPHGLEEVLLACLAKQPSGRPDSAAALADRLRAIGDCGDWDEDRALTWWQRRPAQPLEPAASSAASITIDLDRRDAA